MKDIETDDGYNLWSQIYDTEKNPLITVEESYFQNLLNKIPCSNVLDAGTGTGRHAINLSRKCSNVTAIDSSEEMLKVAKSKAAKENLNIHFKTCDLEKKLPFDDGMFDLITCSLALTHVKNLQGVISEYYRILSRDGFLLISDFHPDSVKYGWRTQFVINDVTYQLPNSPHRREDYVNNLKKCGFIIRKEIDIPLSQVPSGYIPEVAKKNHGEVNLCLILNAEKNS